MKKVIFSILSLVVLTGGLTSCTDDRLDSSMQESVDNETTPAKNETQLKARVTGAYFRMVNSAYYGRDMIMFGEVRSDNAFAKPGFSNRFQIVSNFTLTPNHIYPADTWQQIYKVVNSANLAIQSDVTEGDKKAINQSKAEAYAIRAVAHFDALRLFGQQNVANLGLDGLGVPYIFNFAELDNKNYKRRSVREVRDLIYQDLDKALELVDTDMSNKKRMTKQAMLGFKSRIALFFGAFDSNDFTIAKESAEQALEIGGSIISRGAFIDSFKAEEPQINSVFELAQDNVNNQGNNSIYNIYSYDGYGDVVGIDLSLVSLFNDASDIRASKKMQDYNYIKSSKGKYKKVGTDNYQLIVEGETVNATDRYNRENYRNFGKYPGITSNVKVMRYEELVFNYIEAAQRTSGNDGKALALFNELLSERYESAKPVSSLNLDDILSERRKEFVFEGLRFDDLMRNKEGVAPVITSSDKEGENSKYTEGAEYGSYKLAFPIPQSEINASHIDQNKLKQ